MFHLNGRRPRRSAATRLVFHFEPCGRWHARVTAYIVREHQRGRSLDDILADRFVVEHATATAITRLFEDPYLIHRLTGDCLRQFPAGPDNAAEARDGSAAPLRATGAPKRGASGGR